MIYNLELQLLDGKNYKRTTSYHIVYLEEPYPYISINDDWIDREKVENNLIMNLDMTIFEEVLDKIFKKFSYYDCYEITNFYGNDAKILLNYLENEKHTIQNISENEFEKKYEYIFDSIRDKGDFLLKYDENNEFNLVFSDINLILETLIKFVKKSIEEDKSVTVVGI